METMKIHNIFKKFGSGAGEREGVQRVGWIARLKDGPGLSTFQY